MDSSILPVLRLVLDGIGLIEVALALLAGVMLPISYGLVGAWIMHVKGRSDLRGFALGLLTGIGSLVVVFVVSQGGDDIWGTHIVGWGLGATALIMVWLFLPDKEVPSDLREEGGISRRVWPNEET